jgi:hypothetical protein
MLTEFFRNINTEIGIYATAVFTILSVAFPILLQFIAQLDKTYGSTLIIELFENEPVRKWFRSQLYISIIFVIIWTLKLPPLPMFSESGFFIDYSAAILVIVNTVLLIISFIMLVDRIFLYSTPSKIVRYLIDKHNEGR